MVDPPSVVAREDDLVEREELLRHALREVFALVFTLFEARTVAFEVLHSALGELLLLGLALVLFLGVVASFFALVHVFNVQEVVFFTVGRLLAGLLAARDGATTSD